MTEPKGGTAAIIGLGLIGGSLAHDLAGLGWTVLGYDADAETLDTAYRAGVIDPIDETFAAAARVSVVVAAVPVPAMAGVLESVALHASEDTLMMDVGSTKRSAVLAAESAGIGAQFVGAHPMAGSHLGGWSAAKPGLFRDARVYLCRTTSTSDSMARRAKDVWESVGGRPEEIDATEHDTRVAFTSHVPHATASALARAMARAGIVPGDLGPGGRDALRLASSSPDLWTGIMLDNAEAMLAALEAFGVQIEELRAALRRGDERAVHRFLERAREWSATQAR
jgi:prephenate dehydrogenase